MTSHSDRSSVRSSFEGVIERFEAALQRGESPRIEDYLQHPEETALLVELLHVMLESRLKRGEEASVAAYLSAFPQLAQHRSAVVELIEAEYHFRSRRDPTLDRTAFLTQHYPNFVGEMTAPSSPPVMGGSPGGDVRRLPQTSPEGVTAGTFVGGRYRLVELLGEGGMGEVWAAQQIEPIQRPVAVKFIRPGLDTRAVVQRFEMERQALALMTHPNIAQVLDAGTTTDRRPYFVMELVKGLPLNRYCDEAKLTIRQRLELFVPVCQAVQHAHQKGIIHRDLKPSNVLVTLLDGKPTPKVIDFGVAKALGGKRTGETLVTQIGVVVGTFEYMSPEQAGGTEAAVDTRADIYSLGVILYELLTGLRPLDRKRLGKAAVDEVIRIIREEEPSRPSTRLQTEESSPSLASVRQIEPGRLTQLLRGELDWLVMKCLEKQPDRRYGTADGLARDVQRFLADEPVEARPPSAGYRLQKFLRRNKRSVMATTLVLVAVLCGLAGTTWGLLRAERARAEAEIDRRQAEVKEKMATQLTEYLIRVYQTADPIGLEAAGFHGAGTRDEQQTARQMLDRGAEIVREHLGDQPVVRATLLEAMGNSFRNLGAWDRAEGQLKESYQILKGELGPDRAETIDALQSLAHLARDRGDYAEADRLYREVIAAREKLYSADHLQVAQTKAYLAWMTFYRPWSDEGPQFSQDRLAEAERLLLEVLKVRERHLSANHRDIGYTLAALASIKLGQPRQELAGISYATRAAEVFRKSEQDSLFGSMLVDLVVAEQHRKAGRFDQAEAGQLKVLASARRYLGPRHPLVVLQLASLAGLYRQKGDLANAEKSWKEAHDLFRGIPVLRSQPAIVDALRQYGDEVRPRRGNPEAEGIYREALQYARERPQGNEKNVETLEQRLRDLRPGTQPKK